MQLNISHPVPNSSSFSNPNLVAALNEELKKNTALLVQTVQLKKQIAGHICQNKKLEGQLTKFRSLQSLFDKKNLECETLKNHLQHYESVFRGNLASLGKNPQQADVNTFRQNYEELLTSKDNLEAEQQILQAQLRSLQDLVKDQQSKIASFEELNKHATQRLANSESQLLRTRLEMSDWENLYNQLKNQSADLNFTKNIQYVGSGQPAAEQHSDFLLMTNYYLRQNQDYRQKLAALKSEKEGLLAKIQVMQKRELDANVLISERDKYFQMYAQLKSLYDKEVDSSVVHRMTVEREANAQLTRNLVKFREQTRHYLDKQNQRIRQALELQARNSMSLENMKREIIEATKDAQGNINKLNINTAV